ncbi:hypothetical protein RHMOL_Rhmol11G0000900 [Rhododendron molle]|uniref:Uncharacterized protein n=1 Tax=Rhododendron molle TaxID=49168 RepID=A0ACC0LMC7_RHOML|nr:hypothetical protein RHMOL_Rhmol11G0000900 [Rhododendron molle]
MQRVSGSSYGLSLGAELIMLCWWHLQRWRDTTNTFHLPPWRDDNDTGRFAITGLRVGGEPIPFDSDIQNDRVALEWFLGDAPKMEEGMAKYEQFTKYLKKKVTIEREADQMARPYLLYLFDASLSIATHGGLQADSGLIEVVDSEPQKVLLESAFGGRGTLRPVSCPLGYAFSAGSLPPTSFTYEHIHRLSSRGS